MRFAYTPFLNVDLEVVYKPLVDVLFRNPHTNTVIEVAALIDSGADSIVLNAQLASQLGLSLKKGRPHRFQCLGHL